MRAALVALCIALSWSAAGVRADAIGIPDCPRGAHGVRNPRHGTGWCEPAPCETDADCVETSPASGVFGATARGPYCREVGVCYWNGTRAVAPCEHDGAPCHVLGYGDGAQCHVRRHCVPDGPGTEASNAPVAPMQPSAPLTPTPPFAPAAAPLAPSPVPLAPASCACRAADSRLPWLSLMFGLAWALVRIRSRLGRS